MAVGVMLPALLLGVGVMPDSARAQSADADALKELDDLKKVNDEIKQMKDLQDKGANRTKEESDKLKELEDKKLEKRKRKIEEGLRQRQAGAQQGFAPLLPGTLQKINDYFELQQAEKDLKDEEAKGKGANQKKIDRLKKRIAELKSETPPPTSSAGGGSGVKSASSLLILEEECKPQCVIGQ
jgi:hypothetical protein